MKKTTSQKFSKRLAKYGALSLAIAGFTDANGQIIYTDLDPDEGGANALIGIDFDGEGVDFAIKQINSISYSSSFNLLFIYPVQYYVGPGNAILGTTAYNPLVSFTFNYAEALNSGYAVSNTTTPPEAWNSNYASNALAILNCGSYFPNLKFCGVTDKYIGVRFLISNSFHYGWIRLDVTDSKNFKVKDFAYESSPGVAIAAGDTGSLGIGENELNKIKIVGLNKSIGLYNLPASSSYNIYSMTGQEVLKGETNQKDYVIEASTLASGVYIIELGDTNTNAIIRKKVVLQ